MPSTDVVEPFVFAIFVAFCIHGSNIYSKSELDKLLLPFIGLVVAIPVLFARLYWLASRAET
jgi:hypothetical protein